MISGPISDDIPPLMKLIWLTPFKCTSSIYHYDIASSSEITPCIKIDKPLVVYRFRETL